MREREKRPNTEETASRRRMRTRDMHRWEDGTEGDSGGWRRDARRASRIREIRVGREGKELVRKEMLSYLFGMIVPPVHARTDHV